MSWVRSGYCCRCGECCVGDPFNGELGPLMTGTHCPLYRLIGLDNKIVGHCIAHPPTAEVQNDYYYNNCSVWPDDPRQIADKPSCTYKFTWVD
jgi:hypothetical protein